MSEENLQSETKQPAPPRLARQYREEVVPELIERLGMENPLAVPALSKIVLNMGVGRAKEDEKHIEQAQQVLRTVSGQKPVVTRARQSVAGFGIRAGIPVGCKVTLRRSRMYEFLDRLVSVVLPRIRDFRGLSPNSLDGSGNYSLGIDEHFVFPEIDPDDFDNVYGMDITICTTADSDPAALELLTLLGLPFRQS